MVKESANFTLASSAEGPGTRFQYQARAFFMSYIPAGCRLHETLNWRCLVLSVYAEARKTHGVNLNHDVDSKPYHLIITSASDSCSYKLND